MLDNKLIKNALAICGKPMTLMEEAIHKPNTTGKYKFSIEKFCYYLLSPEFIEKYCEIDDIRPSQWIVIIWWAIYKYQSGNEEPLIELLSKIWAK